MRLAKTGLNSEVVLISSGLNSDILLYVSLLYSHIFRCFIRVNTLFLLFPFIALESAFKMASMQVLFSSVSFCVTMLTDLLKWTVIELY